MATEKRLIDAYLNGEVPKIKTHFAEIIVMGKTEKPYYNIIFIDPQTREYEVCFGSYSLENVRKWLSEEFEMIDAPTVDAVEVVRCKDCINAEYFNGVLCCAMAHDVVRQKNDFCSYGERKDNG